MPTVKLPDRCDRGAAEAVLPELVAALGTGPIEIDGSAVSHVGQAMLQLLVSARRTADGVRIVGSAALRDAARLTGLETELFDESVPA